MKKHNVKEMKGKSHPNMPEGAVRQFEAVCYLRWLQ